MIGKEATIVIVARTASGVTEFPPELAAPENASAAVFAVKDALEF